MQKIRKLESGELCDPFIARNIIKDATGETVKAFEHECNIADGSAGFDEADIKAFRDEYCPGVSIDGLIDQYVESEKCSGNGYTLEFEHWLTDASENVAAEIAGVRG